ncbi:MAG: hypothetical protein ACPGSL_05210 [Vicingaceae bacterium]
MKKIKNKVTEHFAKRGVIEVEYLKSILKKRSLGIETKDKRPTYKINRLIFQESNFYEKVLSKPLYIPIYKIKDVVFLFDHTNDSCWSYDENLELQKGSFIDYHHQEGWAKELIVDKEQGEIYAKFEKGGLCYLKKIDLSTGEITDSFKLEKHTFPTKIKVKNNTAYYLYHDRYNHGQMSLYKQSLY